MSLASQGGKFCGLEVVEAAPVLNVKRTKPRLPIHDHAIWFVKELFEKEAPATHRMAVVGFHHDPAIIDLAKQNDIRILGNRRGESHPSQGSQVDS